MQESVLDMILEMEKVAGRKTGEIWIKAWV